jgi:hypothetical protein
VREGGGGGVWVLCALGVPVDVGVELPRETGEAAAEGAAGSVFFHLAMRLRGECQFVWAEARSGN